MFERGDCIINYYRQLEGGIYDEIGVPRNTTVVVSPAALDIPYISLYRATEADEAKYDGGEHGEIIRRFVEEGIFPEVQDISGKEGKDEARMLELLAALGRVRDGKTHKSKYLAREFGWSDQKASKWLLRLFAAGVLNRRVLGQKNIQYFITAAGKAKIETPRSREELVRELLKKDWNGRKGVAADGGSEKSLSVDDTREVAYQSARANILEKIYARLRSRSRQYGYSLNDRDLAALSCLIIGMKPLWIMAHLDITQADFTVTVNHLVKQGLIFSWRGAYFCAEKVKLLAATPAQELQEIFGLQDPVPGSLMEEVALLYAIFAETGRLYVLKSLLTLSNKQIENRLATRTRQRRKAGKPSPLQYEHYL